VPVLTVVGLQIGFLFSGSVIIQQLFAYPGLGRLAFQALLNRDTTLIQGTVLTIAPIIVQASISLPFDPRGRWPVVPRARCPAAAAVVGADDLPIEAVPHPDPVDGDLPGLGIETTVLEFNLLGDGTRDILDPTAGAEFRSEDE